MLATCLGSKKLKNCFHILPHFPSQLGVRTADGSYLGPSSHLGVFALSRVGWGAVIVLFHNLVNISLSGNQLSFRVRLGHSLGSLFHSLACWPYSWIVHVLHMFWIQVSEHFIPVYCFSSYFLNNTFQRAGCLIVYYFYFMYMCVLPACIECQMHSVPSEARGADWAPWNWNWRGLCSAWCWASDLSSLEEQPVLVTAEI